MVAVDSVVVVGSVTVIDTEVVVASLLFLCVEVVIQSCEAIARNLLEVLHRLCN